MKISISKIQLKARCSFLIAKNVKDFIDSEILPEIELLKEEEINN